MARWRGGKATQYQRVAVAAALWRDSVCGKTLHMNKRGRVSAATIYLSVRQQHSAAWRRRGI